MGYHYVNGRVNSGIDACILCENFVKFGPVTPELTAHLRTSCMTRPKNGPIWSNISRSTGPLFAIFTPYERGLRADDGSVAFFPIYQGTLPWQPNNIAKIYQRRLIQPAFDALELENELQYRGLAMRANSAYDACILCENFVKFGPVSPELTGLI